MKKRIVSMLLVLVMLSLTLVGCGYSMAEDDLSKYATFSAENKAAFEEALKNLVIEDGDFTTDSATRQKKVMETIYASFASNAKAEDAKTEGVPGAHDLVKYCYYMTVVIDGQERIFSASTMNPASAAQLQVGADYSESSASAAVIAVLSALDFKDKTYSIVQSTDKAAKGDVAFVTYKYSYTVTENGAEIEKTGTVTYDRIVIDAAPAEGADPTSLASYLAGQTIGVTVGDKTITEEGKGAVKYSSIKINWVGKGAEATSFKDVTYKAETKLKDVTGTEYDLNDKEITYHIYPINYTPVKEYTPANLIELLGANISVDALYAYILGSKYAGLDKNNDDDKAKIEERAEILKKYKTSDGKTLEDLATSLAKVFDLINNETTGSLAALKKAETAKKNAEETLKKAEEALAAENAKETPDATKVTELTEAVTKATTAKTTADKNFEDAQTLHNTKTEEKDGYVKALFEITVDNETVETKIERGYRVVIYENLQKYDKDEQALGYNYEIKMNLAKEIYYYLVTNEKTNITVNSVPEEAVEMTYEQLIENYKYSFYEETPEGKKESNYKANDGSFKKYLINTMKETHPTVKTYEDAKKAVREDAVEYVKPLVAIYYAADVYGLTVTEKEIKDYKKSDDYIAASGYGENTAIHAFQFDKLLNYFLEYEEKTEADGEYTKITYEYKKVNYTFGTPASEIEEKEETAE